MFRKRRTAPGAPPGTLVVHPEAPPPQVRVVDFGPAHVEERDITAVADLRPYLERRSVTWVDVQGLGDEALLRALGDLFGLHPLTLADIVNIPQRSKTELFPDLAFLVAHMAMLPSPEAVETEQVSLILGPNYVLTFQERPGDCLDPVRERIRRGQADGRLRSGGPDYLAYALLDAIIDGFYPVLEHLGEVLEDLEEELVLDPKRRTFLRLYRMKRDLLTLRRAIWPQRDAINILIRDETALVSAPVRVFLRDCYDHAIQIMDVVETYRELVSGLVDVYLSSVSNRMNEVMKVLTIMATIFIPLTFIAGVYGMNFAHMPELGWRWGYPLVLGGMALVALAMVAYFRRRGWIGAAKRDD